MERACPHWLSFILDNPVRRRFTDRAGIARALSVEPGDLILEMGSGNGFFTSHLLNAAKGVRVVLADIQPRMIAKALKKLTPDDARRVLPVAVDAAMVGLRDQSVRRIFCYFVFHEVKDKTACAAEMYRVLAPDGTLGLWEPKAEVSHRMMEDFSAIFETAGFTCTTRSESRWTRVALFRKPEERPFNANP